LRLRIGLVWPDQLPCTVLISNLEVEPQPRFPLCTATELQLVSINGWTTVPAFASCPFRWGSISPDRYFWVAIFFSNYLIDELMSLNWTMLEPPHCFKYVHA
jgi:hypothetical protein